MDFLPICKEDMVKRGWECCDFVYVIGDAYVDHPSFGHAIISRVLENAGYTVGIISQPDWKKPKSIDVFGRPRLGFLVSGGNMDSMVNHYSVTKHRRKTDAFTPGGVMASDRTMPPWSTATSFAKPIQMFPFSLAASRHPCAGWVTMTTGRRP